MGCILDLHNVVVLTPRRLSRRTRNAVNMLIEEVQARTGIRWDVVAKKPSISPVVVVSSESGLARLDAKAPKGDSPGKEGYRFQVLQRGKQIQVWVIGKDERGVLYGVGHLLRELRMRQDEIELPTDFEITTTPQFSLRGHQIGYRDKTNSYCGWDLDQWHQYIRDMAVFGANAIEIIPPRSDDELTSIHFPLPPLETMVGVSQISDDYGLDVWIWFPAMDPYTAGRRVPAALMREWVEVFESLPRVDALFVPAGDPGDLHPKDLFALIKKQKEVLTQYHPKGQMWVSPQGLWGEWLDLFFDLAEKADWLDGVVFGPQVHLTAEECRARLSNRLPMRQYPDITHSLKCQYPPKDWDLAFALTEGRECTNPRPVDQTLIAKNTLPHTIGALTYCEGCQDDVNKAIWSALCWDLDADVAETLRQYARYFIDADFEEAFAQGQYALERNWREPLLINENVQPTLRQFQEMEQFAHPFVLKNWRFQMALYRAYCDAYVQDRLRFETALETEALSVLRSAERRGTGVALGEATTILDRALTQPVSQDLRTRIFMLAEALFQSVHMQLSVERYGAQRIERGANLDTIDRPLNNRDWLLTQFEAVLALEIESERLEKIDEVLNWSNPGSGGLYEDLGSDGASSRVVSGSDYVDDPAFIHSSLRSFLLTHDKAFRGQNMPPLRTSWMRFVETLGVQPLRLQFSNLNPNLTYQLKVMYTSNRPDVKIRLDTAEDVEVHGFIKKPFPYEPLTFDIPAKATESGTLNLEWRREPNNERIGNGRGCQVSEVWLYPNVEKG